MYKSSLEVARAGGWEQETICKEKIFDPLTFRKILLYYYAPKEIVLQLQQYILATSNNNYYAKFEVYILTIIARHMMIDV